MQQRCSNAAMESNSSDGALPTPSSRSRGLVRSHAMREETSPPREPTPNHLVSPSIKLTPSPDLSPTCTSPCSVHPKVVLSPSRSRNNSPNCGSPTLATNSTQCSSQCASPIQQSTSPVVADEEESCVVAEDDAALESNPKYYNKSNKQRDCKTTSHTVNINNNINLKKKCMCDCQNTNCIKCIKSHEKNINNNVTNINNNVVGSPNMLSVSRPNGRGKLRQQSSSQGSFESASNSPCLSRDSSSEQYTDTTGIDLELFIPETLNRNAKDRALMLRIEQELVNLAKDRVKTHYKFPPMSSYQRMLVHRCAAYFGMDHNIESSGKCVVVNKTKCTRIPDVEFKEHIKEDIVFSEEPRRSILKRDSNSIEDYNFKSPDRSFNENRRSKSFEEREEEYEKARRRIFNKEMHDGSAEDIEWAEMPWSSTESEYATRLRLPPTDGHRRHMKLIKVHSEDTGETMRPCVAKSYSFGGYGGVSVLNRGDSVMSTHSAGPRLLTKQDSAASSVSWRLSPSSSGYKSQSQMSESVTPSPTSTPHPTTDDCQKHLLDNHIVWAVTDIHNVPKGSIIINPQTGKPIKNDDGTLYHYDPNNPPLGFVQTKQSPIKTLPSPITTTTDHATSPKRRNKPSTPNKKLTHSSTSPIMPYSPPIQQTQNRSFQYIQNSNDNITNVAQQQQQQFPMYNSSYQGPPPPNGAGNPAADTNIQVYQQPYIVYSAPFGVSLPPQYDGRMEQAPMPEMANAFYVPENLGPPAPPPPATYQQTQNAQYWSQQQPIQYYQSAHQVSTPPTPQPRGYSTGYLQTAYPQNYIPTANGTPQNAELVPTYQNQPVQIMYPNGPPNPPPNTVIYQNQPPVFYAQNPVYTNTVYHQPQQMAPPPQNMAPYPTTPTPNSCTSSMSANMYAGQMIETTQSPNLVQHISHSMHQMNINTTNHHQQPQLLNYKSAQQKYETRTAKTNSNNNNKAAKTKNFLMNSSQSSTGTNSPAATIVAGYCPQNIIYNRTPPETPPCQYNNYSQSFSGPPPMVFRQLSNVRTSTPGTTRSSRSPTPASDISRFERLSLPPNLYQGMPYVLHQSDARLVSGRGQPSAYRQNSFKHQQSFNQGPDNRNKGRKPKGNRPAGLPPSGK